MTSSAFSSMLFLLLLVFSLRMYGAFGAQTETRKLKETIQVRRNLKGTDNENSKILMEPSNSPHCPGTKGFKDMVTANGFPGDDSFTCIKCIAGGNICLSCTYTRHCEASMGAASCSYKEQVCCNIP